MRAKELAKFMTYMLGVDPTEFGLVPDDNNCYKIKDVLKALNEIEGYRSVRIGDLNELTLTLDKPAVVIEDGFIKAADISRLVQKKVTEKPPKILYAAIRSKAHGHVLREGINPVGAPYILMSSDKETAQQIGKRIDSEPIIVEVRPLLCIEEGYAIYEIGQLFITDYLPPHTFTAPPLPKEPANKPKEDKPRAKAEPPKPPLNPGSFFLDLHEETVSKEEKQRRAQKDKQLKKERQIARRQKQSRNLDFE